MFLDHCQAEIQVEQVVISNTLSSKGSEQQRPVLSTRHTCHWGTASQPWWDTETSQLSQSASLQVLDNANRIHRNLIQKAYKGPSRHFSSDFRWVFYYNAITIYNCCKVGIPVGWEFSHDSVKQINMETVVTELHNGKAKVLTHNQVASTLLVPSGLLALQTEI